MSTSNLPNISRVFKRGEAPLFNILPLPCQGRGIKGVGYLIKNGKNKRLIIY
jgi:hypothetical protein